MIKRICGKSWESNKYPTEWARKRPPGLLLSLVWVGPEKIVDSMWLQDFHLRWLGRYIFAPDPSAGRVSATLARSRMSTTCRIRVWDWNISEFLLRMSQGKKKQSSDLGVILRLVHVALYHLWTKNKLQRGRTHQNLCLTSFKTGPRHGAGFFLGGNTMSSIVQCDSNSPKSWTLRIILGNPKLINRSKLISNQVNKLFLQTHAMQIM